MKGHIPEDKIVDIRNKADIVHLISEFVTLKKSGRNYLGLCPFHKEKTPSFTVSQDKQIFYCFGCGEGGNIISFLMKMNQMSFPEAVRYLAGKTGVIIPEKTMNSQEKGMANIREEINRVNQLAAAYFSRNLFSMAGKAARSYLKDRGMNETVAKEFRLGFAIDGWRSLKDYFEREEISLQTLESAGLIVKNTEGSFYDRFRGRLIFPIEDINNRVIAFGGRIIGNGEPKYLNSPESPLYTKGKNLYSLNRTKEDIRARGYAILVEGYFDLIALWNGGIKNVVATLGTALTNDQIDLLKRYAREVVVIFDPDEAGKKALIRSLGLFLASDIHAKAVTLPGGYDPDSYIRAFGKTKFAEIIDHAQSMVDYYIENIIGRRGSLEGNYDALREAIPFISNINDTIERNLFIKRVSEKLGIDQELLKSEVQQALAKSMKTSASPLTSGAMDRIDPVELSLIRLMLEFPNKISVIVDSDVLDYFTDKALKAAGEDLQESFKNKKGINALTMIDRLGNSAIREKLLKSMISESTTDEKIIDLLIKDTIKHIKKKWYREKHKNLKSQLIKAQERGDQDSCNRLLIEKEKLLKEEKELSI